MSRPDTKSGVLALIAILASNPTEADVATVQTRLQQMHDGAEFDHEPSGHQPNIQITVDGQTLQVTYDEEGNVSGFEGAVETHPLLMHSGLDRDLTEDDVREAIGVMRSINSRLEKAPEGYYDYQGEKDKEWQHWYASDTQDIDGLDHAYDSAKSEGRDTVLPDPNTPSYTPDVEGIVINGGNQTPPTQPQAAPQHYDETDRGAGEAHAEAGENKAPVDEGSAKAEGSKEILPTGVSQDNIDQQEAYQDSLPPDAKVDGTDEARAHAKGSKKPKQDKADDKADLEI